MKLRFGGTEEELKQLKEQEKLLKEAEQKFKSLESEVKGIPPSSRVETDPSRDE
jgi:hypothetical protein